MNFSLSQLGWNSSFSCSSKNDSWIIARVAAQHKNAYSLYCELGTISGILSGKLFYQTSKEMLPVVGDWVMISPKDSSHAIIEDIIPRKTKFSRKAPGSKIEEQIVAANLDKIFIVMGVDQDLNMRRLERFLVLIWESGSEAVVVLNKCDLHENTESLVELIQKSNPGISVFCTSTYTKSGIDCLKSQIKEGTTVAFVGSSGVGKSSLVNVLLEQEIQKVREVREFKDRGKHTTTHREMFLLPNSGLIIDTPGIRELQLWSTEEAIDRSFHDIELLSENCYYRDCRHENEPDCAVLQALEVGDLEEKRYENYQKMLREISYFNQQGDEKLKHEKKQEHKRFSKMIRKKNKYNNKIY